MPTSFESLKTLLNERPDLKKQVQMLVRRQMMEVLFFDSVRGVTEVFSFNAQGELLQGRERKFGGSIDVELKDLQSVFEALLKGLKCHHWSCHFFNKN